MQHKGKHGRWLLSLYRIRHADKATRSRRYSFDVVIRDINKMLERRGPELRGIRNHPFGQSCLCHTQAELDSTAHRVDSTEQSVHNALQLSHCLSGAEHPERGICRSSTYRGESQESVLGVSLYCFAGGRSVARCPG